MINNINIENEFVSEEEASYISSYFQSLGSEFTDDGVYFNWGKIKGQSFEDIEDIRAKELVIEIIEKIKNKFIDKYSPKKIEFKRCLVQTMTEGGSVSLHSDDISAKNEEGILQDVYSAILYLTDNYIGGEINFPNSKIKMIPKTGSLFYFKGEVSNPHYVDTVLSGSRVNFILFFEDIK